MKNIHLIPTDKARLYLHQGKLYDHKTTMHIADGTQIPQHIYITSNEEIKDGDWIKWGEAIYKANKKYIPPFKKIILTTDQDLIKNGVQAISDEFLEWFVNNPSCEEVEVDRIELNTDYRSDWKQKFRHKIIIPKEEQKQHLIDMMKGDEELGLYDELKQDWFCPKCDSYVSSESVTFEETHQTCNTGVVIKEPKQEATLEEAGGIAAGLCQHLEEKEQAMFIAGFIECAKWQSKRIYSEDDMRLSFKAGEVSMNRAILKDEGYDLNSYNLPNVGDFEEWFTNYKKK